MKAKLISQWGASKGGEHEFGAEATIGRGEDNTVRIEAQPVSSKHARIFFDKERYYVEDLSSLNGTELDGTRITRAEPLGRLHVLRFGGVAEFLFVEVNREAAAEPAPSGPGETDKTRIDGEVPELPAALRDREAGAAASETPEPAGTRVDDTPVPLPAGLAELGAAGANEARKLRQSFLLSVETGGETRRFELAAGENVVGRSLRAAIRLTDRDLSRRHAVLELSGDRVTVRDLGSRNKTYVDGEAIEGEVVIESGQVVLFGGVEARLLSHSAGDTLPPPGAPEEEEVE